MSHLSISLLGQLQVKLDGEAVLRFRGDTARALLAYLAVHPGTAFARAQLAALLWPDHSEPVALQNLRQALRRLRTAIGDAEADPPFLLATRATIAMNPESDYSCDVTAFGEAVAASKAHRHRRLAECPACIGRLEEGVRLYRGEFLAGFSLDSALFEEWLVVEREHLHGQALEVLEALAAYHERWGAYEQALGYARRQIEMEGWREGAHRQAMRALALGGQRGAALAQYEACRRALREELDVEPGEETTRLYARIRDGELGPPRQEEEVGAVSAAPPVPSSSPPMGGTEGGRKGWLQGERRTVTALVAAVSGSTVHGEPIDVELRAEVMRHTLPLLGAEIERYGGEVDRYLDDGLIALFGASTAHEDDPERAVLAALAVGEAIQPYAQELAEREGTHLSLRVGINTGDVIAAQAAERTQYWEASATERALALTRGEEAAAEPVTVLVTEDTYRLVAALFEWEGDTGETAYRPLRHKGLPGKGRGIEGLESPLVGRDAEVRALREALGRLRSGIGGVITVVGEAGIGKSRLVAEARRTVDRRPMTADGGSLRWVEGRCLSYATNVAYHLWLDMLRGWLGAASGAAPVDVRETLRERVRALCADCIDEVYPYLGWMMALPLEEEVEARLRGLDAESLRFLTFRAVETALARGAEARPLVVACEDLHWADPTSLALLQHLLSLTDRVPLLFVCVLRPERGHGCWQIVEAALRDYPHCHTDLPLKPLSAQESATLVGNLLPLGFSRDASRHVDDLPDDLRARILDRSEGNPFYVEEILRSLIDGGLVVHDETTGRWQATRDVDNIPIPDTLHGVLAARIDRLPGEARRVLQLASVVGRIFSYPVLAAIAKGSPLPLGRGVGGEGEKALDAHLLSHLVTLERAQLIRGRARLPEREYAFKHVLTQEAAYSSLLRRERRAVHRQVAETLERLYPERVEEQLGLLAHHWEGAGERGRAVAYLRRAGEQAAAQYANEEAIGYLSRALELTPEDDLETRYALLLAREDVYDVQGAREAQRGDLAMLEELAQAMDDDGRRAEVAVCKSDYAQVIADHQAAISAARDAVRLARAAGDAECEAQAHIAWGTILRREGDVQAAVSHTETALNLARAAGLRHVEAASLSGLGIILRFSESPAVGVACSEQALRIYREVGNRLGEGSALEQLGAALLMQGDYDQAKARFQESLHISREIGSRRREAWALQRLGLVCADVGEYTQARDHLEEALRVFRAMGDLFGESETLDLLGRTAAALGDYVEARTCLEKSLGIVRDVERTWEAPVLTWLALLSHYLGDDEAAREYANRAPRVDRVASPLWELPHPIARGNALAGLGQLAEAADAYRQALGLWQETGRHHLAPEPLAGLARVAMAQGDFVSALAHVGEILDVLEARPGLEGTLEPLRVYLTCYQVLRAHDDPRAKEVLGAGYRLLQERADKIEDEDWRRSYLENVPYHREIVAAWEAVSD